MLNLVPILIVLEADWCLRPDGMPDSRLQPNLNFQTGYTKVKSAAFYPVDKMLTLAVGVFPVDYILISFIVYFFVICTMAGVKSLGVRFCHLRLYKIRPRRTVPQGILFFAFILMFTMCGNFDIVCGPVLASLSYFRAHVSNVSACSSPEHASNREFRALSCS